MPEALLEERFRSAVLAFLAKAGAISEGLREKLLGWIHGFSVHNQVLVEAGDAVGRSSSPATCCEPPSRSRRMTYDAPTGTVIYRRCTRP